jgi:putative transposase
MERRQAFRFELMPNAAQRRMIRRFAGSSRFVYNKALALQKEMYELSGKKHTRFQLDRLLTLWKKDDPWLNDAPAHSLQQALVDLDRSFTNLFQKRAAFPKFHKKGRRDSTPEDRLGPI